MEKDLINFMNNVKIINKDLSLYEDDEKRNNVLFEHSKSINKN